MLNMSHEGSHSNVKFVAKFWNDSTQNSWIHISEKHGTKLLKVVNTKLKPCCYKLSVSVISIQFTMGFKTIWRWFYVYTMKLYNPTFSRKIWSEKVVFSFHFRCAQHSAVNWRKCCDLTEKMIVRKFSCCIGTFLWLLEQAR